MQKRKMIVSLIMLLVTLYMMVFTSMAAEASGNVPYVDSTITIEKFEELMDDMQSGNVERIITCCDGRPNLVWRHTKTMHIYQIGGGPCLSLAYFGD